jgi:hypothetical protein
MPITKRKKNNHLMVASNRVFQVVFIDNHILNPIEPTAESEVVSGHF